MRKNILIVVGIIILTTLVFGFSKKVHVPNMVSSPQTKQAQQLYDQALEMVHNGQLYEAKQAYQKLVTDYPDYENIATAQKDLDNLNMQILFSNTTTPSTVIYEVQPGDSLAKVAKKYNTTIDLIKVRNNITSNVIRAGQKLSIWKGSLNIFVDKSQNILILKDGDDVVKTYSVSTGQNNCTPVGTFTITSKLTNPVWFNKGIVVPPESPQNVLGSRWMGFDNPGYGIHGTVQPEAIGQQVTAGCVRMINKDVEELYTVIPVGTKVNIQD
ncbi:MAG: L,D-transpeptidase family protein [Candidatus Omnitrophica bacterium]|nr:L,D-transpeptidase family protein [Candidatus Omnitrophota bacterium]